MKAARLSAATSLACLLGVTAAQAAPVNRIWVSGHGVDQAGCGPPTAPCRSLQYAHDNLAAGGEIDILDPAGYGAINITKAISIVNDGVGTAGVQTTSGWAITINAGPSDNIYLRGLNIDGVGKLGSNGIGLLSGGGLTVVNCVVRHFSQEGIYLLPTSGTVNVLVADSLISDNGSDGIYYQGGGSSALVTLLIDHVIAQSDGNGVSLDTNVATGLVNVSIVDSLISNNPISDVSAVTNTGALVVTLDNVRLNSSVDGLLVLGPVNVHLTRSSIFQNSSFGIVNNSTSPGAIYSTFDNRIAANATGDISGAALVRDILK